MLRTGCGRVVVRLDYYLDNMELTICCDVPSIYTYHLLKLFFFLIDPHNIRCNRPNEQHREYMPDGWAKLVTRRIILERKEGTAAVQGTVLSAIMSHHTHGSSSTGAALVGRRYNLIVTDEGLSNFPSTAE